MRDAQVTTPNSDVIYAMGYLDLGKEDVPMVIEVPPGLPGHPRRLLPAPDLPEPIAEKTGTRSHTQGYLVRRCGAARSGQGQGRQTIL